MDPARARPGLTFASAGRQLRLFQPELEFRSIVLKTGDLHMTTTRTLALASLAVLAAASLGACKQSAANNTTTETTNTTTTTTNDATNGAANTTTTTNTTTTNTASNTAG
jgi:hypothetical protein